MDDFRVTRLLLIRLVKIKMGNKEEMGDSFASDWGCIDEAGVGDGDGSKLDPSS